MNKRKINLLWVNPKIDSMDAGLGVAIDWLEEFSKSVNKIYVITNHLGCYKPKDNIEVFSLGGEKKLNRLFRFLRFVKIVFKILNSKKIDGCFIHMAPIFAIIAFPFTFLKRVPIVQWYAHSHSSMPLKIAERLVHRIVTCSEESVSLKSKKIYVTGHGVDTNLFVPANSMMSSGRCKSFSTIGRISPVKRIEDIILGLKKYSVYDKNFYLNIVGGIRDESAKNYKEFLIDIVKAEELSNQINFVGPIKRNEVIKWLHKSDIFINLSDTDSIDKAILESMSCMVPVITSNLSFKSILTKFAPWAFIEKSSPDELIDSIKAWQTLSPSKREQALSSLRDWVIKEHSLKKLPFKIIKQFQADKEN